MKIVMDAVFNHTGREFFAFEDIMEKEKNRNIWTGIILRNFHLKVKEERFQTINASDTMAECLS